MQVFAQAPTDKQVSDLLEIMQAEQQFIYGIEMGLDAQKKSSQTAMLPEGFFEEFLETAKAEYKTKLEPKVAEIYKQKLSADEIDKLISFYKTDMGKFMLERMPAVQAESAQVGAVWGQELGMRIAQKLMK